MVLVETHVREDHIHLYGFDDEAEREWFRLLQTVQGVGARVALGLLSVLDPEQLTTAIAAQDRAVLTRASGIGPKVAGRILSELKDKAGNLAMAGTVALHPAVHGDGSTDADAISALVNLGYGRAEAFGAISTARRSLDESADVGMLIKAGLKELAT